MPSRIFSGRIFPCSWYGFGLALLLTVGPNATAQSETCNTLNNTERVCEDGFTCAMSFTGGDLFERFTMRVIESTDPDAEVWIIVEINGTFVTFEVGFAEQGEAFAWTVRSEGEGESFFRIDNRLGNDPIRVRFNCDQADTELSEPADAGDDAIEVEDETRFSIGDPITIDPGGPNEETNTVVGFGSLLLETPLQFAHAAGTVVISQGPTATAASPAPAAPRFGLLFHPNPARDGGTLRLALDVPEAVTVAVYDALGREVAVLLDGPLAAGTPTLRLDAAGLPGGVYVVRASGASGTVSRRVTLLR